MSMNQASFLITKIVTSLKNRNLYLLTSSYVVHLSFDYPRFCDTVVKYEQRIPQAAPTVHAITNLVAFGAMESTCWMIVR